MITSDSERKIMREAVLRKIRKAWSIEVTDTELQIIIEALRFEIGYLSGGPGTGTGKKIEFIERLILKLKPNDNN